MISVIHDTCDFVEARTGLLADLCRASPWTAILERTPRDDQRSLFMFQEAGAQMLRDILLLHGGALLADAPGLGKTRTALRAARLLNARPMVVVPAALEAQWRREDESLLVISHTSLAGRLEQLKDHANKDSIDLIIVDEAHGFRTPQTQRYEALRALCLGRRLLFVSATLFHNTHRDICSLLRLFLSDDAVVERTGGFGWSEIESGDNTALHLLLHHVCVRRSRRIAELMERRAPGSTGRAVLLPHGRHGEQIVPSSPDGMTAFVAQCTRTSLSLTLGNEPTALLESVILRRAASSQAAFHQSLSRIDNFLVRRIDAVKSGGDLTREEFRKAFGVDEASQLSQVVFPFWYQGQPATTIASLESARGDLCALRTRGDILETHDQERLESLLALTRTHENLVVFTEFRTTAAWLAKALSSHASVATLSGGMTSSSILDLIDHFGASVTPFDRAPRILIATPVGTEGLNLQSAAAIVHFDLPFTAARLEQRVGRADRIGRRGVVEVYTFSPSPPLERRLRLLGMIEDKATLHNEFIGYLDGRAIDSALEYASRLALTGIANGPRTSRANRYYGILGERDSLYIRDERGTRAFILEDARWRPASPSVLIRDIAVLIESGAPVWSADDEDFHINDLTYAAERHAETRLFDARRRRPRIHALATPFVHALHRDAALFQRAGDTHTATWLLRTVLPTLSGLRTPQHAPLILNLLRQYSTPPETHAGWTTLYHQISSVDDFHDTASAHAESLRRDVNTRRPYFIAVIYSQIPPYRHPRVS